MQAGSVAEALTARMLEHDRARAVQRQIDTLAGKRESPAASLDDLRLADDLARARAALEAENARGAQLARSLEARRDARAGLIPLLEQMLDLLGDSIAADLPFDRAARLGAVDDARRALDDASLTTADRYDAVIGVYRRELQLAYTSGQHRARLDIDGQTRLVTLLRVGRVALYALSDDAATCHVYSLSERDWRALARGDCTRLDAARDDPSIAVLSALPLSVTPR